jgi:hypothetical protein
MLPPFNNTEDLPAGIHTAAWSEVERRYGMDSSVRTRNLARLRHLYELANRTGKLARFLVFGSFVSATDSPRDVDVVLVMAPDFKLEEAPRECQTLFSHPDAEARFGASVFWVREGMLPEDAMREFLDTWQTKRDGTKRGIVEIKP